jgi:hypothetical protein
MAKEKTALVRINYDVVQAVKKICAPTNASIGKYFESAALKKIGVSPADAKTKTKKSK